MKNNIEEKLDVLIVIPVKNEEEHIFNCLQAVLSQDYEGTTKTVVVDNGSTDNTIKIIKTCHSIELIKQHSGTIASLRNNGAKSHNSCFIAFLDGDCVPDKDWLRRGIDIIKSANASCVGFPPALPANNISWVATTWHEMNSSSKYSGECQVEWLSSFNLILNRDYFEKISGFNENLVTCEDYDLGMRLNKISRIIFSDKASVQHLGVVKNLTHFFKKELWRGKNNFTTFLNSENKIKELPSIIFPLWQIAILFCSTFILIHPNQINITIYLILFFAIPLLLVIRKLNRKNFRSTFKMILLATTYLIARGASILVKI